MKKKLSYSTRAEKAITNGKYTYKLSLVRAKRLNAFPKFLDTATNRKKMLAIYISAQLKNLETGKRHHVDHSLPLQGHNISGLHCHTNLRVVSKSANEAKSNYFVPYVIDSKGSRRKLPPLIPIPECKWLNRNRGRANPTKKSSKKLAKQIIFRKRDFYK